MPNRNLHPDTGGKGKVEVETEEMLRIGHRCHSHYHYGGPQASVQGDIQSYFQRCALKTGCSKQ